MSNLNTLTDEIEVAIAGVEPDAMEDVVCTADLMVRSLETEARRLRELLNNAMIPWLERNKQFSIGGERVYLAIPTETKCVDVRAAFRALLDASTMVDTETGEVRIDYDLLCDAISTNGLKHGAARKILRPDVWEQLFKVEIRPRVKREGGPAATEDGRTIQRFNEAFVK